MKNVLVVVNFDAGRKKAVLYKKKLQKFLLRNVEGFKFIGLDDLDNINFSIFDTIIAMGGDGTINRTLPYVIRYNLSLGIIPCGTANLLAARLGIPSNINKAIKVLSHGKETLIDTIRANDKLSILRVGFGYDFDIISKTPQSLKNRFGYFAYFVAGILFALRLKLRDYRLITDNKIAKIKASCIIVSNAPNMYKNGFCVAQNSKLNDGLFDVFILMTKNPILFFLEFLKIGLNLQYNSKFVYYFKTNNLTVKNKLLYAHIDGEKSRFASEANFQIIPNSAKIIL